jgi:uncharacterized protein (DUF488 family)
VSHPFYTIGHATHTADAFVALLAQSAIAVVADVRAFPHSRHNRQFERDQLAPRLATSHIGYVHLGTLGGRRRKARDIAPQVNAFWNNQGFHNYADFALGVEFRSGLVQLRALGGGRRCAIMCAEAVWWRCHRRIIADYLIAAGETVFHILGAGRVVAARLTPAARPLAEGKLVYPQERP